MHRAVRIAVLLALAIPTAPLGAQEGLRPPLDTTTVLRDTAPRDPDGLRAQRVGAWSTAVPAVLGVVAAGALGFEEGGGAVGALLAYTGVALGPSIGNWSGGLTGRGFTGLGIRLGLGLGGFVAAYAVGGDCSGDSCSGAYALWVGSAALALGHAIWDIGTIPRAVERHKQSRVVVTPVLVPVTGRPGVGVTIGF